MVNLCTTVYPGAAKFVPSIQMGIQEVMPVERNILLFHESRSRIRHTLALYIRLCDWLGLLLLS